MRVLHRLWRRRLGQVVVLAAAFCASLIACDRHAPEGGYAITLQMDRAPGPFGRVDWHALYRATGCASGSGATQGADRPLEKTVPITVTRIDDRHYTATVPGGATAGKTPGLDGRCHWHLVSTTVGLSATDAPEDERYTAQLTADEMDAGRPVPRYYWRDTYPRMPGALITRNLGETDPEVFRPEFRKVLFSITLTAKALP